MKNLLPLLALLLCTAAFAQTPITVSNQPGFDATYSDLQTAIDAVDAGSVLYVHGSGVSYGNITISKQVTLYGPGYLLAENEISNTFENYQPAILGTTTISDGANGVIIVGLDISILHVQSDNNIISRSIISGCELVGANSNMILNNFFDNNNEYCGGYASICIGSNCSNTLISGNIFRALNTTVHSITSSADSSNGTLYSNTICDNLRVKNFNVRNNVINSVSYSITDNSAFHNNIIGEDETALNINNNQINIDIAPMFVGESLTSSIDNQYQLKPDAAAIGAADDGGDCGAFGGSSPYILSGLPNLPTVYQIISPVTTPSSGNMNVTVKAKSNQ